MVRRPDDSGVHSDGLVGRALSLAEVTQLAVFQSGKSVTKFRSRLNATFEVPAGGGEPWLKAAVWREYQPGEVICEAGAYGSTAFVLVEGRASATLPEQTAPHPVPGRSARSLARLRAMFRRHTGTTQAPELAALGEVSRYASLSCARPPLPIALAPGEVFGIDTCINFYPREATVRAEDRCVAVEMLRSALDTIRLAGAAGERLNEAYAATAIRSQLALADLFRELTGEQLEWLAQRGELVTNESDTIRDNLIFAEGTAADAVYLVRAGTIRLSQRSNDRDVTLSYMGRGTAFGFEALTTPRDSTGTVLHCTSHPTRFADAELRGVVTLGRSSACELRFPREARGVSRRHCRLQRRGDDLYLTDLDSDNGTILNGEVVREAIVVAGDVIQIVDYTFELTRVIGDDTGAIPATRSATATGLDNFELVRLAVSDLQELARDNERFLESARTSARPRDDEPAAGLAPPRVDDVVDLNLFNSQNVLLIDLDRCTRCDECVKACATSHGGVARFTRDGPRLGHYLVTMACRSCTDPKCMIGCPVGSIRRTESLEIHIEDWCIGCERCASQCPFGNINMVELATPPPRPAAPALRATVCDLCAGYEGPNCVYACPHDAAIRVNPTAFLGVRENA